MARRRLYGRRRFVFCRSYENLWPFATVWSANCSAASLEPPILSASDVASSLSGLAAYSRRDALALSDTDPAGFESAVVPPLGKGGDVYFDDNAWVALALLHQHRLWPSQESLRLARRILAFVLTGWSTESSWSHPGGIRWMQPVSSRTRNTCSNAPVVEVAALVHETTGDPEFLRWAQRIYQWVQETLQGSNGLYADAIEPEGTIHPEVWTYNQGTMIGAGVLLHAATGERGYLEAAVRTAEASLERFSLDELLRQPAVFNAVFFRNLLALRSIRPDRHCEQLAQEYGDAMWVTHRDSSGLFSGTEASVLNNTAPMVEIYSLLAGAEPRP